MIKTPKTLTLIAAILLASVNSQAQELKSRFKDDVIADSLPRYPLLKVLSVNYDYSGNSDYKVNYKGAPDEEGEFSRRRMQVYFWVPFIIKQNFTWSVGTTYTREDIDTKNVINPSGIYMNGHETLEDFNTSLNLNWRTMLFNRQFVVNASVFAGTNPAFKFRKATGQVFALSVIKDSPNTIFSAGLAAIIDPSTGLPIVPVVQYWHRFKDRRYELDVVIPQYVKIRRSETLGGWVSAGVDFIPQSYFLNNVPGTAASYEVAFSELTPTLAYDRLLFNNIMFTIQGGYRIGTRGRIMEIYDPVRDKIATVELGSGAFAKAGLTYVIPNWKVRKTLNGSKR